MIHLGVVVLAYLIGSIPTAVILSRRLRGVDIREIGDGNMGAANMYHTLGPRLGIMVAVIDVLKGTLAVLVAQLLGLELIWQMLAGACAIIGHDFPIFVKFRGGQGTAVAVGTMLPLFPLQFMFGLALLSILFPIIRKFSLSLGISCGAMACFLLVQQQWFLLAYAVIVFLTIPLKSALDSHRRREIQGRETRVGP
jgi:acyl phosphate:glycerol-3-phosphate acyltransferase